MPEIIHPSSSGIRRAINAAGARVYRGGIVDNCARFQFRGDGYSAMPPDQNGHFRIETARQIAGPLRALLDDFVRRVHVIGATQVLKSMTGDCWTIYALEHLRLPMLVLFEDDDKARLFCSRRLIDTLLKHPVLSEIIDETLKDSRFKVTHTRIQIPGATLQVFGLNEGNVSTLSWPLVWVSEAWQHGSDGLLFKAFKRTDRYPDTHKILNESQAAMVGSDLHTAVKDVHQVPLIWKCPKCDGAQTWEWKHWSYVRPVDFIPRNQKTGSFVTVGGIPCEIIEQPKPGTYAGMRFMDDEKTFRSIEERSKAAYWECIWCGHHIMDTMSERKQICETYEQEYRVNENGYMRSPREVCFTIPYEAAYNNPFSRTVMHFLQAKEAKNAGSVVKWIDWFLSERAVFYDPQQLEKSNLAISVGTYETNPDNLMPNSHCRQVTADTGKSEDAGVNENRIGKLWFDIWEWDKSGNGRQLSYGVVNSWELLSAQQRYWKVPSSRTIIDSGYMPSQVEEAAVKFFDLNPPDGLKDGRMVPQIPKAWRMALGAGQNRRLTVPGKNKGMAYSIDAQSGPPRTAHDKTGKMWRMVVQKLTWSNLMFEQQLDSILSHGVSVTLEFLPQSKMTIVDLNLNPSAELTHWSIERCRDPHEFERGHPFASYQSQLNSRYYKQDTGKWEDFEKQSRPTEFRDTLLMQLAGIAADGLIGHDAVT